MPLIGPIHLLIPWNLVTWLNATRRLLLSTCETLFVYGLIVYVYVVGVSYFQPLWLSKQVSHLQEGISWLSWLRNDIMGIVAFVVSLGGFFTSRFIRNRNKDPLVKQPGDLTTPQ